MIEPISSHAQNDYSDGIRRQSLLKGEVAIDRKKDIETRFDRFSQELPILQPIPFQGINRGDFMARQQSAESPIEILVEEKCVLHGRRNVHPRFLEKRDDLLFRHGRKAFEKNIDGITFLQVIKKCLHGETCAPKNGLATKNLRIAVNHRAHRGRTRDRLLPPA
jgi:hypothetical protein